MRDDSPVVRVTGLCKRFGAAPVLENLDLTVSAGESLVVLGGSGSGKSVFIKCLSGLMSIDSGSAQVCNISVTPRTRNDALRHIGMSFQGGALFDSLTVLENVAFGPLHGDGVSREEAERIAAEKILAVDLGEEVFSRYPAELSGGMQKRVALARATARNPQLYLFDEPTAGLDPVTGGVINRLIRNTVKRSGAAAITITHDIGTLRTVADRAVLLRGGRFVWEGTFAEAEADADSEAGKFIRGTA